MGGSVEAGDVGPAMLILQSATGGEGEVGSWLIAGPEIGSGDSLQRAVIRLPDEVSA